MMGEQIVMREELFYGFSLERHVPADPLLSAIDRYAEADHIREAVDDPVRAAPIVDAAPDGLPHAPVSLPPPEPERRCWTTACRRRNGDDGLAADR